VLLKLNTDDEKRPLGQLPGGSDVIPRWPWATQITAAISQPYALAPS
jgi:hypothetical protein